MNFSPSVPTMLAAGWLSAVAACLGGCTAARLLAGADPGPRPRGGELRTVGGVGAEQVRFTFRFKAGPDGPPGEPLGPADQSNAAGTETFGRAAGVRIVQARLNDAAGRPLAVVDQEVRREANIYTVELTSSAVSGATYDVVCQAVVLVGGYRVKLSAAACREVDHWRAEPRSFKFAVYGAAESSP